MSTRRTLLKAAGLALVPAGLAARVLADRAAVVPDPAPAEPLVIHARGPLRGFLPTGVIRRHLGLLNEAPLLGFPAGSLLFTGPRREYGPDGQIVITYSFHHLPPPWIAPATGDRADLTVLWPDGDIPRSPMS